MHHAILGPGGVGGFIGACLGRSGESVTVVVRAEALRQHPDHLRLESPFGNFTVPVRRAAKVPPSDVLWITVKATQLEVALRSLPGADTAKAIVPLLNGVDHIALLRERYGTDRVVPATIAGETERLAPGHIVHRAPFIRLNVSARGREQLGGTLGELQRIGFTCQFIEDEPTLMWRKLVFLAPLALTTSASGATTGEVVADPHWRAEFESCLREACAVATAEGAKVDAEATLAVARTLPPGMRSSMQKDVERGSPPELDAIGGPILRGAARHCLEAPATQRLVAAIEQQAAQGRVAAAKVVAEKATKHKVNTR